MIATGKKYLDRNWLYKEYWAKNKSAAKIAKESGCSETNILQVMKRRNIPVRDRRWKQEEIDKIIELSKRGRTFKDIAGDFGGDKTYEAIRNIAYKVLKIKSDYNPAIRNEKIRQKISASLQGIKLETWDGFKESGNALVRKSIPYQRWREKIFTRDNYTCKKCLRKGVYIVAHHIVNFSQDSGKRMDLKNGITLCKECHINFHNIYGRHNNNIKQITTYLNIRLI